MTKLLDLYESGLTNREIARILKIHYSTVGNRLNKLGLKSKWSNEIINLSVNGATCSKCGLEKPLSEFQHGRKGSARQYRFSFCNDCRKRQVYLNLNNNVEAFLSDRYNRLKRRSKENSIPFNISKQRFIEIYYLQNGMCVYTKVNLVCRVGENLHKHSLSVDKIIPELGYIDGNVVFCANRINTIKHDITLEEMREWMPVFYFNLLSVKDELGLTCLQCAKGNF